MAKTNEGQVRHEATGGLAEGLAKINPGPTDAERQAAAQAPASPQPIAVVPVMSPLATRALQDGHKLAGEYALSAAKLCADSSKFTATSTDNVKKLLRIALAHMGE
jgi:hypothetical protein